MKISSVSLQIERDCKLTFAVDDTEKGERRAHTVCCSFNQFPAMQRVRDNLERIVGQELAEFMPSPKVFYFRTVNGEEVMIENGNL